MNEASPEARVFVSQFVEQHFKGNFILTTQPMTWTPPATARVLELQPLRPDQIGDFMSRQWSAVEPNAKVDKEEYLSALKNYLADISASENSASQADSKLLVLCNPMEASLAAELLAQGEKNPDHFRLVESRFDTMSAAFLEANGREFPRVSFAERVYEWRKSDKADINVDGFENEAAELAKHRLIRQRTDTIKKGKGEETRTRWLARHDRIMEFLMLPAFFGATNKKRRFDHLEDERFWGVYELIATRLPASEEAELYKFLNDWAANTNQNELRNRYERARKRRRG